MGKSLKEFKKRYPEVLLEFHWRQWTALGVASHIKPEKTWIIDPEALLISTILLKDRDKRLAQITNEWVGEYGNLLNLPRFKKIWKHFDDLKNRLRFQHKEDFQEKYLKTLKSFKKISRGDFSPRRREVLSPVNLKENPLIRLRLRNIFGQNVRSEILLYFLYHDSGSSLSIAKEVFVEQKSVYNTAEAWVKTGILERVEGKHKGYLMSKNNRKKWLDVLGIQSPPEYLNWGRLLPAFCLIVKALEISPWKDDTYLLSSLFRDLVGEFRELWRKLDLTLPEASLYPGDTFFVAFASTLMEAMKILVKGKEKGV